MCLLTPLLVSPDSILTNVRFALFFYSLSLELNFSYLNEGTAVFNVKDLWSK